MTGLSLGFFLDLTLAIKPNYHEIISRDVSQCQCKEAFAPVGGNKKLVRCLEMIEEKIVPIILFFFSLLYWTYALTVYLWEE